MLFDIAYELFCTPQNALPQCNLESYWNAQIQANYFKLNSTYFDSYNPIWKFNLFISLLIPLKLTVLTLALDDLIQGIIIV